MSNNTGNVSSSSGIGTAGLLGVLFLALKLMGYITWPWVWVLSPFWIPLALALVVILFAIIIVVAGR